MTLVKIDDGTLPRRPLFLNSFLLLLLLLPWQQIALAGLSYTTRLSSPLVLLGALGEQVLLQLDTQLLAQGLKLLEVLLVLLLVLDLGLDTCVDKAVC